MQGMTLKALLNPFMPHYPPIYKMCLQRVLALLRAAPVLWGFALCQEETEWLSLQRSGGLLK